MRTRHAIRTAAALLAWAVMNGCTGDGSNPDAEACNTNSDCKRTEQCVDGVCREGGRPASSSTGSTTGGSAQGASSLGGGGSSSASSGGASSGTASLGSSSSPTASASSAASAVGSSSASDSGSSGQASGASSAETTASSDTVGSGSGSQGGTSSSRPVGVVLMFSNRDNAPLNSVVTSGRVQVVGLSGPAVAAVSSNLGAAANPQLRVCDDATCFTVLQDWSAAAMVTQGQHVELRVTTSSDELTRTVVLLSILGTDSTWEVSTGDAPRAFPIPPTLGTLPVSLAVSDAVLLDGFVGGALVLVSGDGNPQAQLCPTAACDTGASSWVGVGLMATAGTYLRARVTTPPDPGQGASVRVVVGLGTETWTVRNAVLPQVFGWPDVVDAPLDALVESSVERITGEAVPCLVSLTENATAQYRTCADPACTSVLLDWRSAAGLVTPGEFLQLRMRTPNVGRSRASVQVSVGLGSAGWTVNTVDAAAPFDVLDHRVALANLRVSSAVTQLTGQSAAVPVTVVGDGEPEVRLCADGRCQNVTTDWATTVSAPSGSFIQLRATSAPPGMAASVLVNAGARTDTWTVTTATNVVDASFSALRTAATSSVPPGLGMKDGVFLGADTSWISAAPSAGALLRMDLAGGRLHALNRVTLAGVPGVSSATATPGLQCSADGQTFAPLAMPDARAAPDNVPVTYALTAQCRALALAPGSSAALAVGDFWAEGVPVAGAPNVFLFGAAQGRIPGENVRSSTEAITGLTNPVPVTVTGAGSPEFRVCAEASCMTVVVGWTSGPADISDGQYLQLRADAPAAEGAQSTVQVFVGAASATWTVSTRDFTPDPLVFPPQTNAFLNARAQSAVLQVRGVTGNPPVSITGEGAASFRVCSSPSCAGVWTTSPSTVQNTQYVQVSMDAAAELGMTRSLTLTVGSVGASWTVTTMATDPCSGSTSPGTRCADGTFFVGTTPDGNRRLFAASCDAGTSPSVCGSSSLPFAASNDSPSGVTSTVTGQSNTHALVQLDSDKDATGVQPFPAARACADMFHGNHTDWYLPASDELSVVAQQRTPLGMSLTSDYISSSEVSSPSTLVDIRINRSGTASTTFASASGRVRCVRVEPDLEPDPFTFAPRSDVPPARMTLSPAVPLSGLAGPSVLTAMSPAAVRVCHDAACTRVLQDFGPSVTVYNAVYVQVRTLAPAELGAPGSATVQTGTVVATFNFTTMTADPCAGMSAPPVGTACLDGSLYVGLSPDGSARMYAAPCDVGFDPDAACSGTRVTLPWNNGTTGYVATGLTSANTGRANTVALVGVDSDGTLSGAQPHRAAQACADLNALGRDDWYLPASAELAVLRTNRMALGGLVSGEYWSSTDQQLQFAVAVNLLGSGSGTTAVFKDRLRPVRCVRRP